MTPINNNESAAHAKYELERALLDGAERRLFIGEAATAMLARDAFELSVEWGKLIFAWWDDERSQSWRVSGYELDEADLRLQATRGLGRETAVLTLRDEKRWRTRTASAELSVTERRGQFAATLVELIQGHFAAARARCLGSGGHYARLIVTLCGETILVIGINDGEVQAEIDGIVAAGLIWLAGFNERRAESQRARRLWFCLPGERLQTALERLTFIDTAHLGARVECFAVDERRGELSAVRPATQGELLNTHPRELLWPRAQTPPSLRARIVALAPDLIEVREPTGRAAESYSIHGLEFARVVAGERTRASFGVAGEDARRGELTEASFGELERLVRELGAQRAAAATDRRHPFYRLRAEAWLESLLRRDIHALDATLDARFVYSQIPTWRADERSVLDLLSVDHHGRLAVIEIKAGEDAQLPLQGLDYWLRVEQARARGEFARRNLFAGVTLAEQPPLLYLVAPRLRFHRTFATVARCLTPQIEAYRLGLNTNWRAGVRVHTCERVNQR